MRTWRALLVLMSVGAVACSGSTPRVETMGGASAPRAQSVSYATGAAEMEYAAPAAAADAAPLSVARGGASSAPSSSGASAPSAPSVGATITTTTTTTVEVTVDSVGGAPIPERAQPQLAPARLLTAATVGDHDRRGNYLEYVARRPFEARRLGLDMTRRVRFRVEDGQGQPIRDASLALRTAQGVVTARTRADGRWDFFPSVDTPQVAGAAVLEVRHRGMTSQVRVDVPARGDGEDVTIRLAGAQATRARALDLAFLIDVTGSMEDELRYVNRELADIVARIRQEAPEVIVRVGAVFYRDRVDPVPLQRIAFTRDVDGFVRAMQSVTASGGGDYPEDMNAGLETAMTGLDWSQDDSIKVVVLVADAPPQRYGGYDYHRAMRDAAARGIRILPVAASGADREVEFLFRAMGTYTSTPYVYLTDDSGIGNPHMEADTDRVAVEYFHDALTRLLVSDLEGRGMHEPEGFGPRR
ncbi:MAG: VWA domain-containing protein [Myxococcales bacterium]|nr:VWA domain-containing protein [Myxococcales bacterium]